MNLAEFVFGLNPNLPSLSPLTIETTGSLITATYRPDPDRQRLVEVRPEWSVDLDAWEPVPAANLSTHGEGRVTVSLPSDGLSRFVRLLLSIRGVP